MEAKAGESETAEQSRFSQFADKLSTYYPLVVAQSGEYLLCHCEQRKSESNYLASVHKIQSCLRGGLTLSLMQLYKRKLWKREDAG